MACRMPRGAAPLHKAAMEGALTLAIRMGLPPATFLACLLTPAAGAPELYEGFRSVVRCPWGVHALQHAEGSLGFVSHMHALC